MNLELSAFQAGALMMAIWRDKDKTGQVLMPIFKLLHEETKRHKREAGVIVTESADGKFVSMTDEAGYNVTREKYPWEYEMGII